ncbi:MAG: 3'(2'),5'-bisphosphate nucleotidase CysQ [Candidatus Hydrogenedentota bacterium]
MNPWLLDIAREAGAIAQNEMKRGVEVITKPNGTPVTSVDLAVDRYLASEIAREFPDDLLLSEERPDPPHRTHAKRAWLVDPIDGTSLLIRRQTGFAILIALWESGIVTESIAHFPMLDLTLQAKLNCGCTLNGKKIKVSSVSGPQMKVACTVKESSALHSLPRPVESHCLEVARMAAGEFEACVFRGGPTCGEHDYAWAECALREAGGKMTDEHGDPVRFNKPVRSMPRILVCSNTLVHDNVLNALKRSLP